MAGVEVVVLDWLDAYYLPLLFAAGYLAVLAHHCCAARKGSRTITEFLVANRSLGGGAIALSSYATFVSTNSFIGHAGKSWDVGLIWCVKGVVMVTAACAAWFVVAPRFVRLARRYRSLTVPDFLSAHYGSTALRRLSAAVIVVASVVFLVAVYKGSALALQQLLGLPYVAAAVVVFVVVTAYTLAGGFRSVVMTDALQGALMAVGAVVLLVAVLQRGGGLAAVFEALGRQDPRLISWEGNMPLLAILGLSLAGALKLLVDPKQVSRLYGLRDRAALKRARILTPLLLLITYACLLPLGAFARAVIPAEAIADSDLVMPYLLGTTAILGPVLSSLFLLVLLAAAMSSLDSLLLVAASSVSRDLLATADDHPHAVRRTQVAIFAISTASMLVAIDAPGDIVTLTAFSGALYAACFLPSLVVGLFWRRATGVGALASVIVGAVTVAVWHVARRVGAVELHEVFAGTALALGVFLWIALAAGPRHAKPACHSEPASPLQSAQCAGKRRG